MDRKIESELVCSLPQLVEKVVADALQLINDPERKGGYFCLSRPDGEILLVVQAGDVKREKADKYLSLCLEKARRLSCRLPLDVSSYQSRDESIGAYGGAIAAIEFILSFSGFSPEQWDEAIMLEVVGREPRFAFSFRRHADIIRASNNQFVTETFGCYRS